MVGGVHRQSGGHRIASAHISQDSDSERPSKVASTSRKYSIFSHFPKDRNCEVCLRSKITRAPCRRRAGEAVLRAEMFGDLMTADHKVLREGCESRNNHWYAVVVHATGNCNRDGIPECLEDFTENLEIADMHAPAGISHDSDPERPRKVASRKHSIFTHFPKDPNCEVCKRNKITRTPCRRRTGNSQRSLVILTKSSTMDVKQGTIIDTRSWYKMLPLNRFSRTRAKRKLLRRPERVYESFSSRFRSHKLFTLTIYSSLANLVKNYHGIMELFTSSIRDERYF